jgi:hypothetical protein
MANGMAMMMADGNGNCNGQWWWRRQRPMARATATAMVDGNATEMAAAMVYGNRSNGPWQRRQQWAIATVMVMATAMATELESEMATAMAKETAMARATMKEGLPLHVAVMCSAFGWATPCLHPHGHKESLFTSAAAWGWHCKEYLLPFKGEGSWQLTMDCFLVYYLQLLFSLLNNPLFAPPHYSGAQEPSC